MFLMIEYKHISGSDSEHCSKSYTELLMKRSLLNSENWESCFQKQDLAEPTREHLLTPALQRSSLGAIRDDILVNLRYTCQWWI